MKKAILLISLQLMVAASAVFGQTWTQLCTDPVGDGMDPSLMDGKALSYWYDPATDSIAFKVEVVAARYPPFGVNIVLGITNPAAGPATQWGQPQNTGFLYNRVITAWYATASTGVLGICDAMGFSSGNYTNLGSNNVSVFLDTFNDFYILKVKRTTLLNDTGAFVANALAAVGSNMFWNDDIPGTGAGQISFTPATATSVATAGERYAVVIYPNPTTGKIYLSLPHTGDASPSVTVYSTTGAMVYHADIPAGTEKTTVDLSSLPKGLYYLKVRNREENFMQQVSLE